MSKYYDTAAVIQVIACSIKNPNLLDEDGKYFYNRDDFINEFHRVVFGVIFNLHQLGSKNIKTIDIENYLEKRPESLAIFNAGKGREWLEKSLENADLANFDYYYQRMKKMTLLRGYEACGLDMSFIYDPNELFDVKKIKAQEDYLDSLTLNEISDLIDNKILDVRSVYVDNSTDEAINAGDGIFDLLNRLKDEPDFGTPLYGKYVNTITRGARLGKFYLRSAATGVGKTRSMIADIATIAYDTYYENGEWINNGCQNPSLFISTEMEMEEVQTMLLAFVANVDEDHIKKNKYDFDEWDRVQKAAKIIASQPLYVEIVPDFNLKDVENIIKRSIRTKKIQYCAYDYIHTSMKMLEDITRRSGGVKLREDNILYLLSVKLKEIAVQYNIFVLSSTQLNESWKHDDKPDQNLLRGAKSIADKIDIGTILLNATEDDREGLKNLVQQTGMPMPNMKLSIYKNRGGKYTNMYLWINADKSTCRYNPIFATDYEYNKISIEDTKINFGGGE